MISLILENAMKFYYCRLKLKVENTIRWREVMDDDGNVKKESNARFVKWSDGSFSLHLGAEIFDVYKQPLQVIGYFINFTLGSGRGELERLSK